MHVIQFYDGYKKSKKKKQLYTFIFSIRIYMDIIEGATA